MEKGKKTCMADNNDVRWLQRYDSFRKALDRLESVTLSGRHPSDLSELEKSGLVQWFEFTYELAWKVMQDLLEFKGYEFMRGPNGTLHEAFADCLIDDNDTWRRMAKDRTLMSHTYDEQDALRVVELIFKDYTPVLHKLSETLASQRQLTGV